MYNTKYFEHILQQWNHSILDYLPKIGLAIVIILLFVFISKVFRSISLKIYLRIFKKQPENEKIVATIFESLILIFGIFLALEILGLESTLTKILAGAGIIGIIAGFALKDIASNAFAGFLLNIQHPFKKGQWITIDDNYGCVMNVGWITTSIKTTSGQEVFVPNQLIYNNTFTNFSTFNKRRIVLQSGVSYGDDLEQVKKVTLDEIQKVKSLLKNENIDFYFTSIGNSAYNFEVRFWIHFKNNIDYLNAMSETIMRIKKRFEKENISIAYSVTTLDFGVKGGVNIFDKPITINSTSQGI